MFRLFGQDIPIRSLILVVSDMVLLTFSIIGATWLRLRNAEMVEEYFSQEDFLIKIIVVLVVCLVCFYYNDLYDLRMVAKRWELVIRLAQALGAACLVLSLLYFLIPDLMLGRGVFAVSAILGAANLVAWRLFVDASVEFFRPQQRVLVAGTGSAGIRLVRELIAHPELQFNVVGFLDELGDKVGQRLVNPGVIGTVSGIEDWAHQEQVDCVVLSFAERRGQMPLEQLLRLKVGGHVRIEDAHTMYERLTGRIMLERLSPSWLILSEGFKKTALQRFLKRLIDIVIASIGCLLLIPLMLLISAAIYLESGRPIFFRQRRIGYKGQEFDMLKFRSMRRDSEKDGAKWAAQGDPRITRVGSFIRKYRLDEIPQFVNVLRGEMSVVGPRPEQPWLVTMLEQKILYYQQRHLVRPGITGWAQIRYRYGSSIEDAETKLEYDLFYIKHLSPLFDLAIAFRTVQVMLFGSGAV